MDEIRIRIQCVTDENHAKILRFHPGLGLMLASNLAEVLEGTSEFYIHPPGDGSPIGRCAICGGRLTTEISEVRVRTEIRDAEP
jgi:hypothetical protein